MRKWLVAVVAAALSTCALSQDEDFSKVQIKAEKVSGSVYMLTGAGGNIGVSVGDDGIVIVDDQFAPLATKIQAALKGISDRPVRFVINTHYHGDHTGGNAIFQETSPVIAHDNVRKRLESGGTGGNGSSVTFDVKPADAKILPVITFGKDVTVHLNGEDIRALHIPAGHTDGDAVIFFPKSNVVHLGDDFVTYGFPFVDINSGGTVRGLISGLESLLPKLPADVKIIPGHGALSNLQDLKNYVQMLKETFAAVEKAKASGMSLEQMKAKKILEPWKKWSGDYIDSDKHIETIYNELTGNVGKFVKHN